MEQKNFDNSGSLFINDKKATEKHPDYKGNIVINGQKYWLSGWLRTNDKKDGTGKVTFISLSAEPVEAKPVTGFPGMGSMLQAAATLNAQSAAPAASRPAQAPAPAPAPAPATEDDPKDDLPF